MSGQTTSIHELKLRISLKVNSIGMKCLDEIFTYCVLPNVQDAILMHNQVKRYLNIQEECHGGSVPPLNKSDFR